MRVDIETLQRFYSSPVGGAARRMVARRLKAAWPDARDLDMLGIGFATPYLDPYLGHARRVLAAMPAQQGVQPWPTAGRCAAALADEHRLPFVDSLFDRVLVAHALEEAANPRAFLREIWRVMAPEGRLIVVVANRSGLWARAEQTPFGHGRPYSRSQLAALLDGAMFTRLASARALYAPPWTPLAKTADFIERMGEILWPAFGGVVLMEAVKRLAAEPPRGAQRAAVLAPKPATAANSGLLEPAA